MQASLLSYSQDIMRIDGKLTILFVEAWLLDVVRHMLLRKYTTLSFLITQAPHLSFGRHAFNFFESLNILRNPPDMEIQHFADLLRFFELPPPNQILPYRYNEMIIARSELGIHLCQRKYTLELLIDAGLLSCKPQLRPLWKKKLEIEKISRKVLKNPSSD